MLLMCICAAEARIDRPEQPVHMALLTATGLQQPVQFFHQLLKNHHFERRWDFIGLIRFSYSAKEGLAGRGMCSVIPPHRRVG